MGQKIGFRFCVNSTAILYRLFFLIVFVSGCKAHLTYQGNFTAVQAPYCFLDVMFPDACKDPRSATPEGYTLHLYALKVDFKSGDETENVSSDSEEHKFWNVSETKFCTIKEIPKFPSNCISNGGQEIFTHHVKCLNYYDFVIDRNHNFTNALRITCLAPYPLDLTYQLRSMVTVPNGGIKVLHSKLPVFDKPDPLYRIQLLIPETFERVNLHEYSGNYTVFSMEDPSLQTQMKITALPRRNNESKQESEKPKLDFDSGRIRCMARGESHTALLTMVEASNPTEINLFRSCMDAGNTCGTKILGKECTATDFTVCQFVIPNKQQGIVRCSCGGKSEEKEFFMGLDLRYYHSFSEVLKRHNAVVSVRLVDTQGHKGKFKKPLSSVEVYHRGYFTFRCYFLDTFLVTPVSWFVTYKNGTQTNLELDSFRTRYDASYESVLHVEEIGLSRGNSFTVKASEIYVMASMNMQSIQCRATLWNSSDFIEGSLNVSVLSSQQPQQLQIMDEVIRKVNELEFELACSWKPAFPKASYKWLLNNKTLQNSTDCVGQWSNGTTSYLHIGICSSRLKWNGTYTCVAENFLGKVSQNIHVEIEDVEQLMLSQWIYIGAPAFLILTLLVIIALVYRAYISQKALLSALEIEAFERGNENALGDNADNIAENLPYNKDYEVPWKNFTTENEELGRGAYGIVLKGNIGDQIVAAKTVQPNVEKSTLLALLSELKIMIYLGKHDNLVQLIGACTSYLREGKPYIFVEFCSGGSLESVLKNGRKEFVNGAPKDSLEDSRLTPDVDVSYVTFEENCNKDFSINFSAESFQENRGALSTIDLIRWSRQIANGMEYLESKKVIHADLATRNILLTACMNAKVTDFGLSRQLNNYSMYVKTQQTPLPWRWMAIESLRDMIFTSKSDVWAFGVTLWEIFTLAEIPYPGLTWSADFLENMQNGYRMNRPKYATLEIYEQLRNCWESDPEKRPTFRTLKHFFSTAQPEIAEVSQYEVLPDELLLDEGLEECKNL